MGKLRAMFIRVVLCVVLLLGLWGRPVPAQDAPQVTSAQEDVAGLESEALDNILVYCLAPVFARQSLTGMADDGGLELLADDIAAQFTRGVGAAFTLPLSQGDATLVVRNTNMCSVYVREVNEGRFLTLADAMLMGQGPFVLKEERRTGIATHRFYEAELDGILGVMVSVEDHARPERPQVLFSVARYRAEEVGE